jgi:hypothetical protein
METREFPRLRPYVRSVLSESEARLCTTMTSNSIIIFARKPIEAGESRSCTISLQEGDENALRSFIE